MWRFRGIAFGAAISVGLLSSQAVQAVPMPAKIDFGAIFFVDVRVVNGTIGAISVPAPAFNYLRNEGPDVVVQEIPFPNVVDCNLPRTACRIEVSSVIKIEVADGAVEVSAELGGITMEISSTAGGSVNLVTDSDGSFFADPGSDPTGIATITSFGVGEWRLADGEDFSQERGDSLLVLPAGLSPFVWEGAFVDMLVERRLSSVEVPLPATIWLLGLGLAVPFARGRSRS